MKLLTKEILSQLPKLYSQENNSDPLAVCKFFDPCGSWTWYVLEFDGEDTFFGWVHGLEDELGYFSLKELSTVRNRFGLGIERDLHWKPTPLSKVKSGEVR